MLVDLATERQEFLQIPLSQGYTALVDLSDRELVTQHNWHAWARDGLVYAVTNINRNSQRRQISMHRLILGIADTNKPLVDHINHNGIDNRRANLRLASSSQNNANQALSKGAKTSKYKGVSWHSSTNKWQASIRVKGKQTYLGLFTSEEKAAVAYNQAAIIHFGDFAFLNDEAN